MTHALSDLRMLKGLDKGYRDRLDAAARHRRYPPGQVICTVGDPVDYLVVLLEGKVKAGLSTRDGRELVLRTYDPPVAFDKAALLLGQPHRATLTAVTTVEIAYLPCSVVLELIEKEPSVSACVLRALAESVCHLDQRLVDIVLLDVASRVAKWLLRHGRSGSVRLHAGQGGLAAELGATRVSVNRALKSFERRGLVKLRTGEIFISDISGLAQIVD